MRLGVLFSGGKDSTLALWKAMSGHEIACLISISSDNRESFMFHTPNIDLTKLQAEAMGFPLINVKTQGKKEIELDDLERAIGLAIKEHGIEGVVTGAVASVYQATRIQKICKRLQIWCFNPLWQMDQVALLEELKSIGIKALITGVFAHPLDKDWLGKYIDEVIDDLVLMKERYQINPAGEGGEIESTVIDGPMFARQILVTDSELQFERHSGTFEILDARLEDK